MVVSLVWFLSRCALVLFVVVCYDVATIQVFLGFALRCCVCILVCLIDYVCFICLLGFGVLLFLLFWVLGLVCYFVFVRSEIRLFSGILVCLLFGLWFNFDLLVFGLRD